ncbi:secondary thiamine-phosphate synthase enzyme YjbQ [Ferrimonas senticii]|uniref:secondary thiamine-phosphate synthase enzyme YjbQ n=1 Tax=Ferrimonas senticii TaxID=394566 RepID=UPI0004297572|nr:secondary thiamine-phosphate synthase enzyme YjbQ [Ferrimonas senticii]
MWQQQLITLTPKPQGFHLITEEIQQALTALASVQVGLCHLLLQHTSASLSLNENADPTVRGDLQQYLQRLVPEHAPYFQHTYEGADDMPAHIKAALLGTSLMLPISNGRLALGTWQGIYLGEHRYQGGARRVLVTIQGQ